MPHEKSSYTPPLELKIPHLRRFAHAAMATTFEVLVVHKDVDYARQAAWAAFGELDRLEQELSRFIENSDIARINQMGLLQTLRVGESAFQCLEIAKEMFNETGGAFDISVGSGLPRLKLDRKRLSVQMSKDKIQIDLGGIGKGFAVDKIAEVLGEWDLPLALIHGGQSSVRALESPPGLPGWPITLSVPGSKNKPLAMASIRLQSLSGSGLQKGKHIIDPQTRLPVEKPRAVWVCLPNGPDSSPDGAGGNSLAARAQSYPATYMETLSTAFMIMPMHEIQAYCQAHPELGVLALPLPFNRSFRSGSEFILSGTWLKLEDRME
jgi:FAD:protein FMN transferase